MKRRTTSRWSRRLALGICAVGLALTAAAAWGSKQIDDTTEQRLLDQQTGQAGAVLSTAILLIQQPLTTTLSLQAAGGPPEATFTQAIAGSVGEDKVFVAASLWQLRGDRVTRLASVGVAPASPTDAPSTQTFLTSAFGASTFTVTPVSSGDQRRIAYALADPATGYVVYAERAIPADGRSPVATNAAFAELHYAIYLGARPDLARLSTTDVDPATLPFTGRTATLRVPFGDTVLTLTTTPRRHLGAPLTERFPFILVLIGLTLTALAVGLSQLLVQRRQIAEENAAVAVGMSERLQRALLPPTIPDVPDLEVAVRYVAGDRGVDIGGDWYSLVAIDEEHFGFVVGDVSGRGIDAVAVMARARFTVRAYLLRGDSAAATLSACSEQFDISTDGHIATTIVGIGSWRTGEIAVANAGHCRPLLLDAAGARFVDLATGPPLGTGPFTYATTTFVMRPGETALFYTDGLIERRTEAIDTGMDRLAETAVGFAGGSVDDLVAGTVGAMRDTEAEDDIAVLAFRRVGTRA